MSTQCHICGFTDEDPINYGEIFQARGKSGISVHYYCLLLSTDCPQRGRDDAGILGFQVGDIRRTIKNAKKRRCCYCKDYGASIACDAPNCKRIFHLICGFKKDCLNTFQDKFESYCHKHVPAACRTWHPPNDTCPICLEAMGPYNVVTSVTPDCCDHGWMHLECIRRTALSAGYYLKCLFCSEASFRDYIPKRGVFVPDRDAEWELHKLAYGELLWRYDKCDAAVCQLKANNGRIRSDNSDNAILVCISCAAAGMHQVCSGLPVGAEYRCKACTLVFNSTARSVSLREEHAPDEDCFPIDFSMFCIKRQARPLRVIQCEPITLSEDEEETPAMHEELRFLLQQRMSQNQKIVAVADCLNKNPPPCIDLCSSEEGDMIDTDRLIEEIGRKPIVMPAPLPDSEAAAEILRNLERKELMRLRCEMFLKSHELYIHPPNS